MHSKALAFLGMFLTFPLAAATLPAGSEVVVKSGDHHYQRSPAVAIAPNGDAIVVWADANLGIRARLISAQGVLSAELPLVANLNHPSVPGAARVTDRKDPVVTYDAKGSTLFVFWTDEIADLRVDYFFENRQVVEQDILGRRFDLFGQPMGDAFRVNKDVTGFQSRPQVALLRCGSGAPQSCAEGAIVVGWQSDDLAAGSGPGEGVFGRSFDAEGAAMLDQTRLSPIGTARNVALAADQQGNVLALWDAPDASLRGVFSRLFSAQLRPLGSKVSQLNQRIVASQDRPAAVYNPVTGQFLAVWDCNTQRDRYRTFGRLLSSSGAPSAGQFPVTAGKSEWEVFPEVATTLDGGFAVVWLAFDGHFPSAVRGVEFDGAGARMGGEFNLNEHRPGAQARITLTAGLSGDLLTVFEGFDSHRATSINLRWLKRTH